ncbi:MAG: radical SAM protein [Polyangiaceae bacterium]|nr:radical SAM protein [Polyangiaceae bacterium]
MFTSAPLPSRAALRPHALDGALLWFQPSTGLNLRWDAPATRHIARKAPRVVLFGITNRCNLTCSFCSRDQSAASAWTVESAFEMLSGLWRRGVLEVAFGGGEPLAFPGLGDLVERLGKETSLAVHLTTNGTLLTDDSLARLRPHLGEIRLSVYDDSPWEDALKRLARAGGTFGVNVLATKPRLPKLPALLQRLAELGCNDVAVLRYVGMEVDNHLGPDGEQQLAEILKQSPLRVRLSVCFGDRLALPRLFETSDCAAGLDFVTIGSDKTIKACSFQAAAVPVYTADDVLNVWKRERERLLGPAKLPGCARGPRGHLPMDRGPARGAKHLSPGLRVWRGYSGNNSGDCVLVGRFEEVEEADRYLADLLPGWLPGEPFSDAWKERLAHEGIVLDAATRETDEGETDSEISPQSIAKVGRAVLLHTDMTLEDDFPSLRELVWKRGGKVVYSGVHEHSPVQLVTGLRFENTRSLRAMEAELAEQDIAVLERRGLDLYGSVRMAPARDLIGPHGGGTMEALVARLQSIALRHGAHFAAELMPLEDDIHWPTILAARPASPTKERLWARFPDEKKAEAAAQGVGERAVRAGRWIVVEATRVPPRWGYFIQRCGGTVEWMGAGRVELTAQFYRKPADGPELTIRDVGSALRAYLQPGDDLKMDLHWRVPRARVNTDEPARVLVSIVNCAASYGAETWVGAASHDRLVAVIDRLYTDLCNAEKVARRG